MVFTEKIIKDLGLFWQYPVITEKTFYLQNKENENYIGLPWATIHDVWRWNPAKINNLIHNLSPLLDSKKNYYTCCQQIAFSQAQFLNLWKILGINTVYASHKTIGGDIIHGIKIIACPLYAVNIEDKSRNKNFLGKDLLNIKRDILYSFSGGYQPADYLTDIRPRIYQLPHYSNCYIKNTGIWHFDPIVFSKKQNKNGDLNTNIDHRQKTILYNELLLKSRYTLCPSGSGPNSIRFWEALGAGSIPVLLADTLELPAHELWEKAIVRVKEKDLGIVPKLLANISVEEERKRREYCLTLYSYFKNNYRNG